MKLTPQQRAKNKRIKATYGIDLVEYNRILRFQKGVCYICGRPPARYALSIDHKHVPKDKKFRGEQCRERVRGLLCIRCNRALEKFRDDSVLLRRAADYLESPPAQIVLKGRKKC